MNDLKQPLIQENSCKDNFSLRKGGIIGSLFSLFSSTVGCVIIGLPYAFYQSGLICGLIVMVLSSTTLTFFYIVLCEACEQEKTYTYVGLLEKLYGPFLRRFTEIVIILLSVGVLGAVQALISGMLLSILKTCGWESVDEYRIFVITIYNLFVFIPLIIPKELTALRIISCLSLVASIYIALVVIVETPSYVKTQEDEEIPMFNWSIDIVDSFALIIGAFDCSRTIPIIFEELKPRKFNRMYFVVIINSVIVFVLYALVAVCGLISEGENTTRLVTDRPAYDGGAPESDILMVVARIAMAIVLLVAFPMHLSPLKKSMQQMILGSDFKHNPWVYYPVTFGFLGVSYLLVVLVPDAVIFFKFIGGVFVMCTACVLPNLVYFKVADEIWKPIVLCFVTGAFVVVGWASAIKAVYEGE